MFGIGIFELLIIGLLVLLFVQPKNLPSFFFKLGKFYNKASMSYQRVLREMNMLRNKVDNWRRDINELSEMENFTVENPFSRKQKSTKARKGKQTTAVKKKPVNKKKKAVSVKKNEKQKLVKPPKKNKV